MTYSTNPTVVWFRRDLRLADNRALTEAVTKHAPILPIYIWGYEGDMTASYETRSVWWLLKSLRSLDHDLKSVGSKLVILKGNPLDVMSKLAYQISPQAIYWNKVYEPNRISLDRKISLRLDKLNIEHSSFEGQLLWNPEEIRNLDGGILVQDVDNKTLIKKDLEVVTDKSPSEKDVKTALFAWKVLRHAKSNGILIAKENTTIGLGAGQVSRVDAVSMAIKKGGDRVVGSVLASDAFFPFRDSIDAIKDSGISSVIQPGGSIRDQEVIDACNENGISMLFTGVRCFKH